MSKFKRIGVLTSGGDAPGMNAAVRAVTRLGIHKGIEVYGIYNGYQGLMEGQVKRLGERDVSYIINRGGTMLYTARSEEFKTKEGIAKAVEQAKTLGLDGIVTIGGDGTFRGAGDIALNTAIAVGAVAAIITELPTDYETLFAKMIAARKNGKRNFIVILCEGMGKNYGEELCKTIEERTGIEARFARPAHIQRGGSPTLRDRVLATQMGCAAVESLVSGQMKKVVCLRDNSIITMDIHEALFLDKILKNTITQDEIETIPPNTLYDLRRIVADRQAYKSYLNYIINHMAL